jgi:uncharacterized membrane protein
LLLAAGICLLVAAHWDALAPAERFTLLVVTVAALHGGAALLAERVANLASALHAVGTVALGAGIFLTGQTFNLQEHWPAGVMLWAIGAAAAWGLLRDWPQAALTAILVPAWLCSEWEDAVEPLYDIEQILPGGLLLLAVSYLTAKLPGKGGAVRNSLLWIGGIALIPCAIFEGLASAHFVASGKIQPHVWIVSCAVALAFPLLVSVAFRGRRAWLNGIAALWVITLELNSAAHRSSGGELIEYILFALGAIGLIAWGMMESRRERVNLGVAGFALTVLVFYFSEVMDKLERSVSLISLGVLFLLGGWALEKTRRRLVAQIQERP